MAISVFLSMFTIVLYFNFVEVKGILFSCKRDDFQAGLEEELF